MSSAMDRLRQRRKQIAQESGDRAKTVKPPQGESRIRILPHKSGDTSLAFDLTFGQHFIKDEKDDLKAVYVCVDKAFGRPCPVCAAIQQGVNQATSDGQIEALDKSKAGNRVILNALIREGGGSNVKPNEPVLLDISPTLFGQIIDIFEQWGGESCWSTDAGMDLIFNRTGTGMNTRYTVQPAPPNRNEKAIPAGVLDKATDLDEWAKQEYDAGLQKAITAVNTTVGLLPSSSAASNPAQAKLESSSSAQGGMGELMSEPTPAGQHAPETGNDFNVPDNMISDAEFEPVVEEQKAVAGSDVASQPAQAQQAAEPAQEQDLDALLAGL